MANEIDVARSVLISALKQKENKSMFDDLIEARKSYDSTIPANVNSEEALQNAKYQIRQAFLACFNKHTNVSEVKWKQKVPDRYTDQKNKLNILPWSIKLIALPKSKYNNKYVGKKRFATGAYKGLSNEENKSIINDLDLLFVAAGNNLMRAMFGELASVKASVECFDIQVYSSYGDEEE
jgi:hypothetical protein